MAVPARLLLPVASAVCVALWAVPSVAQTGLPTLDDFFGSIPATEVRLTGMITHMPSLGEWTFEDSDGTWYPIRIDDQLAESSGLLTDCLVAGAFLKFADACGIEAVGTATVEQGRVFLTITRVIDVSPR